MAGARLEGLSESDPAALGTNRLLGRLASGGMGRIYLAQAADGQLVAVKTLLAEGEVSDIDRRRFAREVKLAQRIDSAFTARVREADPDAEQPWMAIDYIAAAGPLRTGACRRGVTRVGGTVAGCRNGRGARHAAPREHHPPGCEAAEHPASADRPPADRLRHLTRQRSHPHQPHSRNHRLHLARAGTRRDVDGGVRRVLAGRDTLPPHHGAAAVPRRRGHPRPAGTGAAR